MPELSKVALQVDSNSSFPNNNNGYITPAILRSYNTNVIDSTVNQIQYTTDSGSWNQTLQSINAKTGSYATTSSLAVLSAKTGSYATTGSNAFIGNQVVTGTISASFFSGDGSGMTGLPAQTSLTPLNDFTASQNTKDSTLATYTGSIDTKFSTIGSASGSWINTSLNTYTQSQDSKNIAVGNSTASLNTYSASVDTKFTTLSNVTASILSTTASLNTYTQSLITAFTASGTTITVNGTTTLKSNLYVTGGVYQNVVSQSIVASTASIDLSQGTYFTLTLADNATTHIRPTNLAAGTSATIVITTGTNSTASLSPLCLQAVGNTYTATVGTGKIDLLSLVSTNTSNVFVASTKNLV
mgnify:CR=1 FL=1